MRMMFGIPATMKLLFTLSLLVQIARAAVKGKTRDISLIRVFRISVVTIQSGICKTGYVVKQGKQRFYKTLNSRKVNLGLDDFYQPRSGMVMQNCRSKRKKKKILMGF